MPDPDPALAKEPTPLRLGTYRPENEVLLSSAVNEARLVDQLQHVAAGRIARIDIRDPKGEWASVDEIDLAGAVARNRLDAFLYSPKSFYAFPFVARERARVSVPIVVVAHKVSRWLDTWLLIAALKRPGDLVIAPTRHALAALRKIAPRAYEDALVVPFAHGVEAVRAEAPPLPDPPDPPLLTFLGRLTPEKGLHLVLEALPGWRRRFPGLTVQVMGPPDAGYLADVVEPHGKKEGLEGAIEVCGVVSEAEKRRRLARSTLLLNPTLDSGETFAAVNIDALAAGIPVVAAAWDGIPEVVTDGESGALVPVEWAEGGPRLAPGALERTVADLLSDPARLARLRAGAREAAWRFDAGRVLPPLVERLVALKGRPPRPDPLPGRETESAVEDRWAEIKDRPFGAMDGLVGEEVLAADRAWKERTGGGDWDLPLLAETTPERLVRRVDDEDELWRAGLKLRKVYLELLMR